MNYLAMTAKNSDYLEVESQLDRDIVEALLTSIIDVRSRMMEFLCARTLVKNKQARCTAQLDAPADQW